MKLQANKTNERPMYARKTNCPKVKIQTHEQWEITITADKIHSHIRKATLARGFEVFSIITFILRSKINESILCNSNIKNGLKCRHIKKATLNDCK